MIAKVYKFPSWILNQDNKPSLELFNLIKENSADATLDANTVDLDNITYTKLKIQTSFTFGDLNTYNYVLFNNCWYAINDISVKQVNSNETLTYIITATIDIYLSFIIPYFSEDNANNYTQTVFFKQKHLNRWLYDNNGNTYINFSDQFYLKNKHDIAIGSSTLKIVDSAYELLWNNSRGSLNAYSNPLIQGNEAVGYVYAIWKITSNNNKVVMLNNWTSMGLVNIQYNWNQLDNFNISGLGKNTVATGLPWSYLLGFTGQDAYVDLTVLPVPIDIGLVWNGTSYDDIPLTTIYNFANNSIDVNTSDIPNWLTTSLYTLLYPVEPQNISYILSTYNVNSYNNINNIFSQEPYLLQYCSFRVRGAGEDAIVDITGFNNWTTNSFIQTMYSFTIHLNHPNTQITNINIAQAMTFNTQYSWLSPYEYNKISDAYWTINWKSIYPSSSNNWNNYLLNNACNYHMGLSIAHYNLQSSQADVGFNTARLASNVARVAAIGGAMGDPISDLFNSVKNVNTMFNAVDDVINSGEQLTNSIFGMMSQKQEYQYQLHGKQKDMSRTANERLAVSNNIISYNNFALTYIWEQPVAYEIQVAINYVMFNGYILERWEPFSYWLNRKYLNYVKIAKFTDTMMVNLNSVYKALIDNILNQGLLIWTSKNGYLNSLPYSDFVNNPFSNPELNQNNNEVIYLCGGLLSEMVFKSKSKV